MTHDPQLNLNETVERIIHSCESRDILQNESSSVLLSFTKSSSSFPQDRYIKNETSYENSPSQSRAGRSGKLTENELSQLSLFCTTTYVHQYVQLPSATSTDMVIPATSSMASDSKKETSSVSSIWSSVDSDLLTSLTSSLEEHVTCAACIDVFADARKAFDIGDSGGNNYVSNKWSERLKIIRQGLEAACILLFIMTSSGVDRRIISEDAIDSCISLMRNHLSRNTIPALSNTGYNMASASSNASNPSLNDTPMADGTQPPQRKKQRTNVTVSHAAKCSQALLTLMKKVRKKICSSIGQLALLMERIDLLIQVIPVDDQPLLSICSTALSSLTIVPPVSTSSSSHQSAASLTNVVQMASLALVTTVFRKYSQHRIVILEDLFPIFLKLPTSKKFIRKFPVSGSSFGMVSRKQSQYALSSASKCKKAGPVRGEANIQVMSALILFLVQACVTMPFPKNDENKKFESSSSSISNDADLVNLTSGLIDCESVCQYFTAQLIQRCSKKGEEGGASEFRPVLSNLVEDLLYVQTVPDFPAADMLLLNICRKLSYDLVSNSSVGGVRSSTSPAEGTYLTTAMDTIGYICADIALKIVASREKPLEFPKAVDVSSLNDKANLSTDSNEVNRCFCGRTSLVDTFMLDCDRCHNWFHGTCVGVAKDSLPEVWMCDECTMQLIVLEQTKLFTVSDDKFCDKDQIKMGEIREEDQTYMMKILLLNFLSNQAKTTKSLNTAIARKFHIANFIKDINDSRSTQGDIGFKKDIAYLDKDALCTHLMDMWHLPDTSETGNDIVSLSNKCEYLSEEGNATLMLTLYARSNNLASSFPRLLGVLLSLMGDERIVSLRKLAVKAVAQVVKVDSSLMSQPKVRNAVAKRFQDAAISVREAAVTLVGIYVLLVPSLANVFHRPLTLRLKDNGISVRKRVIKIFRDLMLSNPVYSGRAEACTQMLQCAADPKEDDGVRDLIHESFQTLWFESKNQNDVSCRTSPTVVTPGSDVKRAIPAPLPSGSYETAKQMVEVVKASSSPDYLTSLVKDLLFGFGEGDKSSKATARKERQFIAQKHCSTIVTALIEQLIAYEELRVNQNTPDEASGLHLVGLISTLGVFADASPDLLLKDLDVLLPYLKADNSVKKESEALIVLYVCKILCHVSSCLSANDIQRLSEGALSDDLLKITYTFGSNATSAAVEALAKMASREIGEDGNLKKKLMKLTVTFFSYLTKTKDLTDDFSKAKPNIRNNVHRALSVLGSICKFHVHGKERDEDPEYADEIFELIDHRNLTWENVPTASYALFNIYISKLDTQTKCKALKAMAGIFLACPRIMLVVEQNGLIEDVLSNSAPVEVQLEALQCLREILVSEEMRVESGDAKRQMEANEDITLTNQISGDQSSDASLIGACCIQHASRLFELTANTDPMIRLNSVLLIETLLRQGLINPMDTVPHLLALQGDIGQPGIRAIALKLLTEENQKRPDMIRQRLASGVKRSYLFQRKVYSASHITALLSNKILDGKEIPECIFGQIYKDAIRSSRSHSTKILLSLLGLFTNPNKDSHEEMDTIEENSISFLSKLPLLCFAAEIIAHLPYNHLGDVLFIVHHISGSIAMEGNEFMMKFADFLHPYGLTCNKDADLSEKDLLETAAMSKKPSKNNALKIIHSQKFDISLFAELCAASAAMVLLLRLKLFLSQAYSGITEVRLREYLPNDKERITDRGVSPCTEISRFNATIPNSYKADGQAFDKDGLIKQYAEFRSFMRENYDFHICNSSDNDEE